MYFNLSQSESLSSYPITIFPIEGSTLLPEVSLTVCDDPVSGPCYQLFSLPSWFPCSTHTRRVPWARTCPVFGILRAWHIAGIRHDCRNNWINLPINRSRHIFLLLPLTIPFPGFPRRLSSKEPACNPRVTGDIV